MFRAFPRRTMMSAAVVVALAVVGAGAWLLRKPAVVYETAPVKRASIEASVTAIGTLQPQRYVDVLSLIHI